MSAVSGSSASQGLYSFFQNVSTRGTSAAAPGAGVSASNASSSTGGGQAVLAGGGRRHGHHGGGAGGALFKQIQSAVSDALSAAQSDPSADPNTTIENAIAKIFKDNGITPPTAPVGERLNRPLAGAAGPKDADGDTDGSAGNVGPGGQNNSARQAFFNTLKQYGVDPQQFRQDFLAAVKDAQNGTVKSSTALQSLPTGLTVDTTA